MTIENNKKYKLTGEQIKDLASRFGVLSGEIGDLSNLTTTDKTNLVAAINEAAGGGGGPTVVQTTGTSTTDVMSQNAVTSMVFADPAAKTKVQIGGYARGAASISIGNSPDAGPNYSIAIGSIATASTGATYSIALGAGSETAYQGQMDISTKRLGNNGYSGSQYRLLTGLYDGQSAHDAATYGQLSTAILNGGTTAPTTATVGAVGTLYSYVDTTGATPTPHLMVCIVADTVTPSYTWVEAGGGGGSVETYNDSELEELWEGES